MYFVWRTIWRNIESIVWKSNLYFVSPGCFWRNWSVLHFRLELHDRNYWLRPKLTAWLVSSTFHFIISKIVKQTFNMISWILLSDIVVSTVAWICLVVILTIINKWKNWILSAMGKSWDQSFLCYYVLTRNIITLSLQIVILSFTFVNFWLVDLQKWNLAQSWDL